MLYNGRRKIKGFKISLIIFVIVIGVLLLMFNSGISVLKNISGVIVIPIERVASDAFKGVGNFFSSFGNKLSMQNSIDEAQAKLAQQETVQALAQETQNENQRLRDLLGEQAKYPDMKFIYTQVILRSTDNFSVTYTLNKGSADGIKMDMPVVAVGGLAGRIIQVDEHWCIMMAIIDSRSAVPALAEVSRDIGIVKGISDAGNATGSCSMTELPTNALLRPGDTIITSGMGGVFPKGINIGKIIEVSEGTQQLNSYAEIAPGVDFDHLENLLVLDISGGE